LCSLCFLLAVIVTPAHAQRGAWPEKPVRLIVASPVGSGDDVITRIIAPKLSELLGQQFLVDNRPGAAGLIGQTAAMKSPPDGHTFLLAGGSMAGARYANAQATYDVLRDFTPVSLVETSPFVMVVHPGVPANGLRDYIKLARSHRGNMHFATLGPGQIPYWSAVLFNRMAAIEATEVRYSTIAFIEADVITGRMDYFFAPASTYAKHKGKIRALGVTTPTRSSAFPDLPTIAEAAVPGYEMPAWRSIMGPAGIHRDVVARLNAAIARTLGMPDVRKQLLFNGSEPAPSTPEELASRYAEWIERFGKIAKQVGLKPQ
jgi:tripartite-type tricarboxylate transporter receptor subunit TctC